MKMQLKESKLSSLFVLSIFLFFISFSVSSCSKKTGSNSEKLSLDELIESTDIDLSLIPKNPKIKSEAEKIVESYQGDSHKLAVEVDSLIIRFPNSFLLRAVNYNFYHKWMKQD